MDARAELCRILQLISCPVCSSENLELGAAGASGAVGVLCRNCEFRFQAIEDRARLLRDAPGVSGELGQSACPSCQGRGGELLCRCDLPSRERFHVVRCLECGFLYKREATLI